MGNSATMKVVNNSADTLQTFITGVTCMYDDGQDGSNLSVFNDANIGPNQTFPDAEGQYIETKNSGSCWGVTSTFNLKIDDYSIDQEIGEVFFEENAGWSYKCSNPDVIDVDISGDPTSIVVTIQAT